MMVPFHPVVPASYIQAPDTVSVAVRFAVRVDSFSVTGLSGRAIPERSISHTKVRANPERRPVFGLYFTFAKPISPTFSLHQVPVRLHSAERLPRDWTPQSSDT